MLVKVQPLLDYEHHAAFCEQLLQWEAASSNFPS
jgi:hypothetical protein